MKISSRLLIALLLLFSIGNLFAQKNSEKRQVPGVTRETELTSIPYWMLIIQTLMSSALGMIITWFVPNFIIWACRFYIPKIWLTGPSLGVFTMNLSSSLNTIPTTATPGEAGHLPFVITTTNFGFISARQKKAYLCRQRSIRKGLGRRWCK